MPKINTYLSFNGNAAEAMRFYEQVLGGKLDPVMTYDSLPAAHAPPGSAGKVMHAQLALADGGVLMASDSVGGQPYEGMKGFSTALFFESADDARRVFETFTKGGMAILPLQPSFFAEIFGMVVDRFGAPWAISGGVMRQ